MKLADLLHDGLPLGLFRAEDLRAEPLADGRPVRGNGEHVAAIDPPQLGRGVDRRTGHSGQLLVAEKEVLDRDPGGLARGHGHLDALLGLDRLVQALAPLAALGQTAGELVDDHDLAVADDVLPVELVLALDEDRPLDVAVDVDHAQRVQFRRLVERPDLLPAFFGQFDGLLLVVELVVFLVDELVGDRRAPPVAFHLQLLLFGGQGADDQGRAGFVDQDAVGLVDQGEVGGTLHRFFARFVAMAQHSAQEIALAFGDPPQQEAIAEEIEAELLGRAVGHVALVGLATVVLRHLRLDHAHRHAQGAVDGAHPFGVAAGEVVVHRGQVAAFADQGIEIHGQRGRQGLAFAGLHLDDRLVEHGDAAQDLHVEVPHVEGPPAGLADQGVGLDQQLRERLPAFRPIAERRLRLRSCSSLSLISSGSIAPILGTSFAQFASRQRFAAAGKRRKRRSDKVEKAAHERCRSDSDFACSGRRSI